MQLYFLRHGDASSHSRFHDSERPLSPLGQQQAVSAGTFFNQRTISINAILTSPLTRAWETGSIIQSILHVPHCTKTEYLVNGTNPKHLFRHLRDLENETFLLIGHEPFLSDTISLLIGGNQQAQIEIGKCSLALVEIEDPERTGTGLLRYLLPIEILTALRTI